MWRVGYGVALALGLIVFVLLGTWQAPASITNRVNGADLRFTVERQRLWFPWQCTWAAWDVEGIENIFFDDAPTVGQERKPFCPSSATNPQPLLYVDFVGNFIQTYSIPVTVLSTTPVFWGIVATYALLGLLIFLPRGKATSATPTPPEATSRRQFLLMSGLGVALIVGGALGVRVSAKPAKTIHDGWLVYTDEIKR